MWWNGASRFNFDGKSLKTETTTLSDFPNGGKAIVEQILASEETNKSKRAWLWESQSENRVGKLTLSLFLVFVLWIFHWFISFDCSARDNHGILFCSYTAQKTKFSTKDFFSKCDQIRSFLRIWSHLLNKSLMENCIFCAVLFIVVSFKHMICVCFFRRDRCLFFLVTSII